MKTYASVTETLCTCEYLQRRAEEPDFPIAFHEKLNEFNFIERCDDGAVKAEYSIYHCPFCGGAAPKSTRKTLFKTISDAEDTRIRKLFDGLKSVEDILQQFGPADWDHPNGFQIIVPEKDNSPPTRYSGRVLRYSGLSESADVDVHEHPGGTVSISLTGKQNRPKEKS